jgi:hypothetical protein
MQPAGAKATQSQHRNTRHNDISPLAQERKSYILFLEFSGLYQLKERGGRSTQKKPLSIYDYVAYRL